MWQRIKQRDLKHTDLIALQIHSQCEMDRGENPECPRKSWRLCQTPNISRAAGECQQSPLALTVMQKNSGSFLGSLGYGSRWPPCCSLRGHHCPHTQLAPPRGLWLHLKWLSWDLAAFVKGVQRDSGGWQRPCGDWSACPGESS